MALLKPPVEVIQGGTGRLTLTAHSIISGNGDADVAMLGPLTDGQLLIGSTGNAPAAATLTAGAGISIANAAGSITLSTLTTFNWLAVPGVAVNPMVAGTGYLVENAALTTFTLPAVAAKFDEFEIVGLGATGWTIAQNAGQTIHLLSSNTTVGVAGSLASTHFRDRIRIMCVVANTEFTVRSSIGTFTIT
jgi:hypothetical protein